MKTTTSLKTAEKNLRSLVDAALEDSGGLLRLAPCWVPRTFVQPGRRLKLHPDDLYAYGLNRGGIDERWFASTTPAVNENRTPDEGLSYCIFRDSRFTLASAVEECGADLVGETIWGKYQRWPVFSKIFDNMGPIPHHMHQSQEHAKLVGQVMVWAAQSPQAANEIFNVTNGDVFEWRSVWPAMAETLGVKLGADEPASLARYIKDNADVWSKIVAKYGLASGDLRAFVGQGDQHADFAFAFGAPAGPVAFVSTVKLRKAGFNAAIDTRDAFCASLRSFIDRRLLPPARH